MFHRPPPNAPPAEDWAEEAWSSPWAADLDSRSAYLDAPTAASFLVAWTSACTVMAACPTPTTALPAVKPVPLELWGHTGTPAQSARSDL